MTPSILLVLDIYVIDANGSWHCLFMMRGLVWIRIVQTVHLIWHGTYSWAKVCNYSAAVLVRIWVHLLEMVECVGRSPFTWSTFQHIWPNHNSNPTLNPNGKVRDVDVVKHFASESHVFFVFFPTGIPYGNTIPLFSIGTHAVVHTELWRGFSPPWIFEIRNARKKSGVTTFLRNPTEFLVG